MKILKILFGVVWILVVWFMVAVIVGVIMVRLFPPLPGEVPHGGLMVGIGPGWRNLPGMVLGSAAALQSWRRHLASKRAKPE